VRKYVAWEGLACEKAAGRASNLVRVRISLTLTLTLTLTKAAGRASNLRDTRDWDLFADREYRRLVDAEEEEGQGGAAPDDAGSGGDAEEV